MDSEQIRKIRSTIIQLADGMKQTISLDGLTNEEIHAEAKKFCQARKIPCTFGYTDDGVVVTRSSAAEKINLYPELDALEIGKSKLFELPPAMHQKIRMAAGYRAAGGMVRLACNREGDFMRVTRLPMTDAEAAACGPIQAPARATKYSLGRLGSVPQLHFCLPKAEHAKLRLAVHREQIKTGWSIRCRLQDDGSMLVYRTDSGAPHAAKQAAE